MVKFAPRQNTREISTGLSLFREAPVLDDAAKGMMRIGAALGDFADAEFALSRRAEAEVEKADKLEAHRKLIDLERGAREKLSAAQADAENTTARDFYKNYQDTLRSDLDTYIDTLPENIRDEFQLRAMEQLQGPLDRALSVEQSTRQNYMKEVVGDKAKSIAEAVRAGADPKLALQQADDFAASLGASPATSQFIRQKMGEGVDNARLEFLRQKDPLGLHRALSKYMPTKVSPKATGVQRYLGEQAELYGLDPRYIMGIVGAESGFNPDIKNPNSSARGLFQFINSTGRSYGLRNDGTDSLEAQVAAGLRFTRDNQEALQNLGVPVTPGAMYGMHFLGRSYAKVLASNPNADFLDTYVKFGGSPSTITVNKGLLEPGMTNAQALAAITERMEQKMKAHAGVILENEELADDVDFDAPVVIGDEQLSTLKAGDLGKIFQSTREDLQKHAEQREKAVLSQVADSGDADPFDERGQKAIAAYAEESGIVEAARSNTPEGWQSVSAMANKMNHVPDNVSSQITRTIIDPRLPADQKISVYETVKGITDNAPLAAQTSKIDKDVKDRAEEYRYWTTDVGLTATEAIKRVEAVRTPEEKLRIESFRKSDDYKKTISKRTWRELSGGVDAADRTGPQTLATEAIYRRAFEYHYGRTGDEAQAISLAQGDLGRMFGQSQISGSPRYMPFPPERTYPAFGGSHDYVRKDMRAAVDKATGYDDTAREPVVAGRGVMSTVGRPKGYRVPDDQMFLVPTGDTARDVAARDPAPRYTLVYRDANGLTQQIPEFRADTKTAFETAREKQLADQKASEERTRQFLEMRRRARAIATGQVDDQGLALPESITGRPAP